MEYLVVCQVVGGQEDGNREVLVFIIWRLMGILVRGMYFFGIKLEDWSEQVEEIESGVIFSVFEEF